MTLGERINNEGVYKRTRENVGRTLICRGWVDSVHSPKNADARKQFTSILELDGEVGNISDGMCTACRDSYLTK